MGRKPRKQTEVAKALEGKVEEALQDVRKILKEKGLIQKSKMLF